MMVIMGNAITTPLLPGTRVRLSAAHLDFVGSARSRFDGKVAEVLRYVTPDIAARQTWTDETYLVHVIGTRDDGANWNREHLEVVEQSPLEPLVAVGFVAGARVRATHDLDTYVGAVIPTGSLGTVVAFYSGDTFAVRLDDEYPDLAEWGNEKHWYLYEGDDPTRDLEVVESERRCACGERLEEHEGDECAACFNVAEDERERVEDHEPATLYHDDPEEQEAFDRLNGRAGADDDLGDPSVLRLAPVLRTLADLDRVIDHGGALTDTTVAGATVRKAAIYAAGEARHANALDLVIDAVIDARLFLRTVNVER